MKAWYLILGLVLVCGFGCASLDDLFENEKEVPLSQVPPAAVKAAEEAVDGITLTEAEMETEDGKMVYSLEGTADGKEYSIEVTPEGKVLEVEEENADDKDDTEDKD